MGLTDIQVQLTTDELVELRAAQRTFEVRGTMPLPTLMPAEGRQGAYIRTALSQFSFALVILKIFTAEFYSIVSSSNLERACCEQYD